MKKKAEKLAKNRPKPRIEWHYHQLQPHQLESTNIVTTKICEHQRMCVDLLHDIQVSIRKKVG